MSFSLLRSYFTWLQTSPRRSAILLHSSYATWTKHVLPIFLLNGLGVECEPHTEALVVLGYNPTSLPCWLGTHLTLTGITESFQVLSPMFLPPQAALVIINSQSHLTKASPTPFFLTLHTKA